MADWPYNTTTWQKLRKRKLASEPLCYPCKARGLVTPANAVDHIKPINAGGDAFPPLDGLMSMCERCHNEKTASNDRTHIKPFARKVKGFDGSGNPFDQSDAWHGGGGSNHEKRSDAGPTTYLHSYLVSPQGIDEADDLGFA